MIAPPTAPQRSPAARETAAARRLPPTPSPVVDPVDDATAAQVSPPADAATLQLQAADRVGRRQQRNLALAAGIGTVLFVFVIYLPSGWRLNEINRRIDAESQQLRAEAERASSLPEAEVAADRLESTLKPFKPLPLDPKLGDFIAHVTETTTRLRLRDVNLKPGEVVREESLSRLPVELSFSGDFINAFDFLRITEALPRPLRVRALTVKQTPPSATATVTEGDVDVTMTISLFFRAPSGG